MNLNSRKCLILSFLACALTGCQPSSESDQLFKAKEVIDTTFLSYESPQESEAGAQYFEIAERAFREKDYVTAKQYFMKAAEAQSPLAMAALGDLARLGLVPGDNLTKAGYWYDKALDTKDPQVQYHIAQLIINREWQDKVNPSLLLEQAANNNYSKAQLLLAKLYHQGRIVPQNNQQAFKWYLKAVEKEPEAMTALGLAFFQGGLDIEQNEDLGIKFLKQAAKQDYYPAQYALASLYVDGYDVLKDRFQAVDYLKKEANANNPQAQVKLARAFVQFGLPEYDKAAYHWFSMAANAHNTDALYWLAVCYNDGIGTPVDYDKAFNLLTSLAEDNYVNAYLQLGKMYYNGQGTLKDLDQAKTWILKAYQNNVPESQHWVATLYRENLAEDESPENIQVFNQWLESQSSSPNDRNYIKGINHLYGKNNFEQNTQLGIELLIQAANNQYLLAQRELGRIYEENLFDIQNPSQALHWYLMAAENGDDFSQLRLAQLYYQGVLVAKNLVQAYAWANLAALNGSQEAIALREDITNLLSSQDIQKAQILSDSYFSKLKQDNHEIKG